MIRPRRSFLERSIRTRHRLERASRSGTLFLYQGVAVNGISHIVAFIMVMPQLLKIDMMGRYPTADRAQD